MDTIQSEEKSPHVIVSTFKEGVNPQDVEQATGKITTIIDEWNVRGNMIWTGAFNDGKSAMSVIEASKIDAQSFFNNYNEVCKSFLDAYMYQWDAMPVLSLLGKKQIVPTLEAPTPEATTQLLIENLSLTYSTFLE